MPPAHAATPLWLVLNPASGSVDPATATALEGTLADVALPPARVLKVGTDELPTRLELEAAGVATLALFAGDGTVNQAVARLDGWDGAVLVLPGGTMNLLAKTLHGDASAAEVVTRLATARLCHLPAVEAEGALAYVSLIAGPLAAWARPREALRDGHLRRLARGVRVAVGRLSSPGVRVIGPGGRLPGRGKAVFVAPLDGSLAIAAITNARLATALAVGRNWARGDWTGARDVATVELAEAALVADGGIHALVDGEERTLTSPVAVRASQSRVRFLATRSVDTQ